LRSAASSGGVYDDDPGKAAEAACQFRGRLTSPAVPVTGVAVRDSGVGRSEEPGCAASSREEERCEIEQSERGDRAGRLPAGV
jgi:hypothetical protein